MSIMALLLKILLFFGIFYGAIGMTTFVARKIRERQEKNEASKGKDEKGKNEKDENDKDKVD